MKNFISVSTGSARFPDISLNPQKLAGMCAKLKCCLNYEVDNYIEASRRLPNKDTMLQTQDADYYHFKSDILAGMVTYSTDKNIAANLETITAERAKQIIEMNRKGEKPLELQEDGKQTETKSTVDLAGGDVSRFDKAKKKRKKKATKTADAEHQDADKQQPKKGAQRQQRKDKQPQQAKEKKNEQK